MRDELVDEITTELQRKEQEKEKNLLRNVNPKVKFLFALAIAVAVYFYYKGIDIRTSALIIGAALFIIWFTWGDNRLKGMLTEQELKILLWNHLRFKQSHPLGDYREIPEGRIKLMPQGRVKFLDHKPWRYECGFSVVLPNGLERIYSAEMDPYSGALWGMTSRPYGYSGQESADIEVIRDPRLRDEQRYQDALGVKKYRENL